MLTHAVSTFCGHTFCKKCLYERQAYTPKCKICYFDLSKHEPNPCLSIDDVLKKYMYSSNNMLARYNYEEKLAISEEWEVRRSLNFNDVQTGTNIDVKDDNHKWTKGVVVRVMLDIPRVIMVEFLEGTEIKRELFEEDSTRVAPWKFYTGKNLTTITTQFFNLNNTLDMLFGDYSETIVDSEDNIGFGMMSESQNMDSEPE